MKSGVNSANAAPGKASKTYTKSAQVLHKPSRGPAKMPGSYRDVEERTGIPQPTIRLAEAHVSAVERYPETAEVLTQQDALTIAKNLDALPEPARDTARDKLQAHDSLALTTLAEKSQRF